MWLRTYSLVTDMWFVNGYTLKLLIYGVLTDIRCFHGYALSSRYTVWSRLFCFRDYHVYSRIYGMFVDIPYDYGYKVLSQIYGVFTDIQCVQG